MRFILIALLMVTSAYACSPGEWFNGVFCLDCPTGHYCQSDTKFECPRGTFNPFNGQDELSDCQPCVTGTFSDTGEATCVNCPVPNNYGSYSKAYNDTTEAYIFDQCGLCKPGTFRMSNGVCGVCKTFNDPECYPCGSEPGIYCPNGTNNGNDCPIGYWCNWWETEAHKCGPGQSSPRKSDNLDDCYPCLAGTMEQNGTCFDCPIGWTSTNWQTECVECENHLTTVDNVCVYCPEGTRGINHECIPGTTYPFNWYVEGKEYSDLVCIENDDREICSVIAAMWIN